MVTIAVLGWAVGRTGQSVLGGTSTLEMNDQHELVARRMRCGCLVALDPEHRTQGKGSAVAAPVGQRLCLSLPTGLGLGRSNVSKVGIFR